MAERTGSVLLESMELVKGRRWREPSESSVTVVGGRKSDRAGEASSRACRAPERKRVRGEGEKEWVAAAVEGK
jgi:hypothetical protein